MCVRVRVRVRVCEGGRGCGRGWVCVHTKVDLIPALRWLRVCCACAGEWRWGTHVDVVAITPEHGQVPSPPLPPRGARGLCLGAVCGSAVCDSVISCCTYHTLHGAARRAGRGNRYGREKFHIVVGNLGNVGDLVLRFWDTHIGMRRYHHILMRFQFTAVSQIR